jgi:hypothetical protein
MSSKLETFTESVSKKMVQNTFLIDALDKQLHNDESEYMKLKQSTKASVRNEIEKLSDLTGSTKDEFKRVNSYLDINHKMITLLLEDNMINHLLLE